MGLIKAIGGAIRGTMADQWKEYFYVYSLPDNVLATKAEKKVKARFGGSRREDDNVISDGSVIAVADGQCMMIVDQGKIVDLMTRVEQLQVQPDQLARVVIDESSGIVVIGKDVKINRLAIAQGNLTIKITDIPFVSQPLPFSNGTTVSGVTTAININEGIDAKLTVVNTGVNLQELVDGLNALGVTPRDLISILQAIKASGALQAEIEVI